MNHTGSVGNAGTLVIFITSSDYHKDFPFSSSYFFSHILHAHKYEFTMIVRAGTATVTLFPQWAGFEILSSSPSCHFYKSQVLLSFSIGKIFLVKCIREATTLAVYAFPKKNWQTKWVFAVC